MTAAGYVRISSEEAAREGFGLGVQEQAIRTYSQAHGLDLTEVYIDAGRSGKSTKGREELARLLADAQAGAFEVVVFTKLDRLARRTLDLLTICDTLEAVGVGIVCIDQNIDTTTAVGKVMRTIIGAFAEFEREVIVERITAGLAEKARQGEIVGPLPLGYVRGDNGAVGLDPVAAPLIREAYERYSTSNYSMRDMAGWAAGVGLRSSEGNPLDRLSVRKLLSNETYTGMVTHGGAVVANGKHPAIVDAALFVKVQETMQTRNRYHPPARPFGKQPYPLSGTATCSACGEGFVGVTRIQGPHRYGWYRCSTTHRRGKDACAQKMVRTNVLEEQIAAYVGGMRLPPEYLGEVVAELRSRRQRPDNPEEVISLRKQHERWRNLYVMGEIDERRLKAETAPIKVRLAELERPTEVLDVEDFSGIPARCWRAVG